MEQLVIEGVEVAFGIPAVQSQRQYDALYEVRGDLRHVVARNEQGAGFMADGYGRTAGKPAALFAVGGPGITNALTALGEASAACSPMVVISNVVAIEALNKGLKLAHHVQNQIGITAPVTAWNKIVYSAADIPASLREATNRLRTSRPGPVELEIPVDISDRISDIELVPAADVVRPGASESELTAILSALDGAKSIVIFAGVGVIRSGAWSELTELAERLDATVLCSVSGRGSIPDDHDLSVGSLWMGADAARGLTENADLLLVVGARLDGMFGLAAQHIARIDIDDGTILEAGTAAAHAVGDARTVLRQLLGKLSPGRDGTGGGQAGYRRDIRRQSREFAMRQGPVAMEILAQVRAAMPDGALLTTDSLIGLWANRYFELCAPRSMHNPMGFGTLGFALPGAIGAHIGGGGKPVVALGGDGAFMFTCGELATAVQEGSHVCNVILNDRGYEAIRVRQRREYDGRYIAADLTTPDFVKFGESFGIPAMRVESVSDLGSAIETMMAEKGPTLIEVMSGCETPPAFPRTPPELPR